MIGARKISISEGLAISMVPLQHVVTHRTQGWNTNMGEETCRGPGSVGELYVNIIINRKIKFELSQ